MQAVLSELGLAVVLFVSTNIDDVFVLLAFFADPRTRTRDIVVGQYLGIGALYLASVIASLLSLVFAAPYMGLLGFIPIAIGLVKLRERWRGEGSGNDAEDIAPATNAARLLSVAAITIANGGDNIGVYTPVFATRTSAEIVTIVIVFAVLVALLLLAAHWLVRHPALGAPIRRYGPALSPWVLIAIGVFVIYDSLA
jgi:cadmium resistance protein CadD (predicted permease)